MVTEWVDATKLVSVGDVRSKFKTAEVLVPVFNFFADMIFRDGFVHCDPHPANLMVRWRNEAAKKDLEIVVLDFGLCISESESFRLAYGLLFKAMFTHDTQLLHAVVKSWGISNPELFAAMTIQKPYSRAKPLHTAAVTRDELIQMQLDMKKHVTSLLQDEELVPTEIVFVGRCLNLLRAVNKLYGAPINRINLMARRAVMGLGPVETVADIEPYINAVRSQHAAEYAAERRRNRSLSSVLNRVTFEATLLYISLVHTILQAYSAIMLAVLGRGAGTSLEDVMESSEAEALTGGHAAPRKSKSVHGVMKIDAND
jgi:aarF domain-containing kinase